MSKIGYFRLTNRHIVRVWCLNLLGTERVTLVGPSNTERRCYFLSEKVPLYEIPLLNSFNRRGKSNLSRRLMSLWLKRNLSKS